MNISSLKNIFFTLGFVLLPFYFRASGTLQISQLLLFIIAIIEIIEAKLKNNHKIEICILFLLFLVMFCSLMQVIFKNSNLYFDDLVFLFFNLIIVLGLTHFFSKLNFKLFGLLFVICPILVLIYTVLSTPALSVEGLAEIGRPKGPFNNPNQLGYYSVCSMSILYLTFKYILIDKKKLQFILYTIVFLISIYSLSKAAIISNLFFILIWTSLNLRGFLLFFACFAIYKFDFFMNFLSSEDNVLINRFSNALEENDSSLEARGYILYDDVLEFFFGIGSHKLNTILGHEVHSTFAHFFMTYGFFAGCLFLYVIFLWAKKISLQWGFLSLFFVLFPAILYGFSHNGSRFIFFWVLFSFSLGLTRKEQLLSKYV